MADPGFAPTMGDGSGSATVGPGESRRVGLTFANLGPEAGQALARLTIRSDDRAVPRALLDLRAARSGEALVAIVPLGLDLGAPLVGCASPPQTVTLWNGGTADAVVSAVEVTPACAGQHRLEHAPLPAGGLRVAPGERFEVTVQLIPQDEVRRQCSLRFPLADGSVPRVSLWGGGTCEVSRDEQFGPLWRSVDVLLVIDDGGHRLRRR